MIKSMINKFTSLNDENKELYAPVLTYFMLVSIPLLALVLASQMFSPELMKFILKEDGPSEWFGFFILFYGSFIAFYLVYKKYESIKKIDFSYAVLLFLAVGMMFAAMEEISYGQRIFNWGSGEFFQSNNSQKETNLHNMVVNGVKVNKLIFGKILFLLMLGHNIIFPFMVRKLDWAKKMNSLFGNFAPLIPQILVLIFVAIGVEFIDYKRKKEVMEVVGCLFYVLATVCAFGYGMGGEKIQSLAKENVQKILKWFYIGVPISALVFTFIYN